MARSNRPNKQERQRRNRQAREARAARSARAGEATEISEGLREPVRSVSDDASGAPKRPTRQRPERKGLFGPMAIPGQRAVLMAFLFALVSAGTLLLSPISLAKDVAVDDPQAVEALDGDDPPEVNDDGTVTVRVDTKLLDEEGAALGGAILLLPAVITGTAVAFTKRPQRSTAWTAALLALSAFIFLLAGPWGIISLPSLVALGVGGFQSRRAENKERLAELKAAKAARAEDGEVIDVDPVGEDAEVAEASVDDVDTGAADDEAE